MASHKTIFLCWSGTRSKRVADGLGAALATLWASLGLDWDVEYSPQIAKGSIWFEQILANLGRANAAIVCLTPENADNPWMHFEAGAVAARLAQDPDGRVFPYLFRMGEYKLEGPMSQYQTTHATSEDTLRLVRDLLTDDQWQDWPPEARRLWWAELEKTLQAAEDRPLGEILPKIEVLFGRKTFNEPLDECVNQSWFARLRGAQDTHQQLKSALQELAPQCRPYVGELLEQLREAVDSYAMALELLLSPMHFDLQDDGKRSVPAGLLTACEGRRVKVKQLVSGLADPTMQPVLENAPRFHAMESFAERKALVHQFEYWLGQYEHGGARDWRMAEALKPQAANSRWELDRIAHYLARTVLDDAPPTLNEAVGWLRMEFERARASSKASHMPLYYCLGPLKKTLETIGGDSPNKLDRLLTDALADARTLLGEIVMLASAREKEDQQADPSRLKIEAASLLGLLDTLDASDHRLDSPPATNGAAPASPRPFGQHLPGSTFEQP